MLIDTALAVANTGPKCAGFILGSAGLIRAPVGLCIVTDCNLAFFDMTWQRGLGSGWRRPDILRIT